MTIDAGQLDRRLDVLRRTVASGDKWGDVYAYEPVNTLWAALKHDAEDERHAAEQAYAVRVVTFTTRYSADLFDTDRLECEGVEYEVIGIRQIGRREGLEIKARVYDPGAV